VWRQGDGYINNEASINDHNAHIKSNNISVHIQSFLANARVAQASDCGRGITWYELYILYRIRGYPKPLQDPTNKANNKAPAYKPIRNFTKQFRGTANKLLLEEDSNLFKPHRIQKDVLVGVGIQGNHAAVSCNIHTTQEERKAIAEALLMLSRSINKKTCDLYLLTHEYIIPKELKLNGKASWEATIDRLQRGIVEESPQNRTWDVTELPITGSDELSFYRCPTCPHVESSQCSSFQTSDLDRKQKCNACRKMSSVRLWKCDCKKHWHNCARHRAMHGASASQHELKSKPVCTTAVSRTEGHVAKRSRTLALMTPDQILEEDMARAKRKRDDSDELGMEPTFFLGKPRIRTIRVASLPPSLKRRFLHPGGE